MWSAQIDSKGVQPLKMYKKTPSIMGRGIPRVTTQFDAQERPP